MQHRFVVKFFAAAKMMGVHTALDTNGYYGDRLSDADLDVIDLDYSTSRRGIPNAIDA